MNMTDNVAETVVRRTIADVAPTAEVALHLVSGATVTGTVEAELAGDGHRAKSYRVTAGSKVVVVPAGCVVAVGIPA